MKYFSRPSKQIYVQTHCLKSLNRLFSTFKCYPSLQYNEYKYKYGNINKQENNYSLSKYNKRSFVSPSTTFSGSNDFCQFEDCYNELEYEQIENVNDYDPADFVLALAGLAVSSCGVWYIYDKQISKHMPIPDALFYMSS
eukprot:UN05987